MKTLSFLIKPASSACNMKCRYCFYYDVSEHRDIANYGVMSTETIDALVEKSLTFSKKSIKINYCFQGGEPLLAGYTFFEDFLLKVEEKNIYQHEIHYAIQTNGTLLSEKFAKIFKKYDFLVGVSLDGMQDSHDYFRKTSSKQGTFELIKKNIKLLQFYNIEFNILTVLTNELSKRPEELFSFYSSNNYEHIQLIPCLPNFGDKNDPYALTPQNFASFYKRFYKVWLDTLNHGRYISISLFDNVIPMYKGKYPNQCGMLGQCEPQFVIESNGDVFPCDFYVLDNYKCGNINHDTLQNIIMTTISHAFLKEKRRECKDCEDCPFISMCHKNCKRLNICYYDDVYCGYRDFLTYTYASMQQIAKQIH